MDFDVPTDEFVGGDVELDPVVYKGKADSIDYRKEITEEGFAEAQRELAQYLLHKMKTAQYCIRGVRR